MCSTNNTQKIVGSEVVRLDGTDKVTGRTKFSGDLKMNGMCCLLYTSPSPRD